MRYTAIISNHPEEIKVKTNKPSLFCLFDMWTKRQTDTDNDS